jgi:hypothetical protein
MEADATKRIEGREAAGDEKAFLARAEAKDQDNKKVVEQAAAERQCKALITNFTPTTSRGAIDSKERDEVQATLNKYYSPHACQRIGSRISASLHNWRLVARNCLKSNFIGIEIRSLPTKLGADLVQWHVHQEKVQETAREAATVVEERDEQDRAYALAQQAKVDSDAAIEHLLNVYVKKQGPGTPGPLLQIPENRVAIAEFIKQATKNDLFPEGYFSPQAIDAAIANLGPRGTNKLKWGAPPPPPAPPVLPVPPPPEVRMLANGEPELPLDADERTMRRASKEQLRDLSKRRREGRQDPYRVATTFTVENALGISGQQ